MIAPHTPSEQSFTLRMLHLTIGGLTIINLLYVTLGIIPKSYNWLRETRLTGKFVLIEFFLSPLIVVALVLLEAWLSGNLATKEQRRTLHADIILLVILTLTVIGTFLASLSNFGIL
jgi:hypothetical protein